MKIIVTTIMLFLISSFAFCNYTENCNEIWLENATLHASCPDSHGQNVRSAIRLRGVSNVNGSLTFLSNTREKSDFHYKCKNVGIDSNGVIFANCPNNSGKYTLSTLSTAEVLINDNGSLVYPAREQYDITSSCSDFKFCKICGNEISAVCLAENGGRYRTQIHLRGVSVQDGKLILTHDGKDYMTTWYQACESIGLDSDGNIAARCEKNSSDRSLIWSVVNIKNLIVNKNGSLVLVNE